jgi:fatty-acid peroxygenase
MIQVCTSVGAPLAACVPMTDPIPRDPLPDSTFAALRHGYRFIGEGCERTGSDVFEARLLGRPVICLRGASAAELFYDTRRFVREGALPRRVQKTIFGEGGVQTLDDAMHRARKRWFLAAASPARVAALAERWRVEWQRAAKRWPQQEGDLVLLSELERMACRAVCDWAGVPLAEMELAARAQDFASMIAAAGALGPRHWQGRRARQRAEQWLGELIDDVRDGRLVVADDSLLARIVAHVDADEAPLSTQVAAVEIINVLRPTVAVARFVAFAALALHEHPRCRDTLHDAGARWRFVQEVRRYYPFVPFVAARTRRAFAWGGVAFPAGALVLLDLYGTNHDERLWTDPDSFRPRRFAGREPDAFALVPQGGGSAADGHRCPGEGVVVALMDVAVEQLGQLRYDVPEQDLSVSCTTLPTQPASGFVVRDVRMMEAASA